MRKKTVRTSHVPPSRRADSESRIKPTPRAEDPRHRGSGKLDNKIALITGGDSGIGRAVAIAFAKEGADIAIVYLKNHKDAEETQGRVEAAGRRCITVNGDLGDESFCRKAVQQTVKQLGNLDILVNNAAEEQSRDSLEQITAKQLQRTFQTNIYSYFYVTKAALKYLKKGSSIINTTSVTAYRGSDHLIDYAATKGAIVSFTRSLSKNVVGKGIRVNGVAPGPIWTPLVASAGEKIGKFGKDTPMKRPGQPEEVAPCFVFLASDDSSYMTGQILHPNGGEVING